MSKDQPGLSNLQSGDANVKDATHEADFDCLQVIVRHVSGRVVLGERKSHIHGRKHVLQQQCAVEYGDWQDGKIIVPQRSKMGEFGNAKVMT